MIRLLATAVALLAAAPVAAQSGSIAIQARALALQARRDLVATQAAAGQAQAAAIAAQEAASAASIIATAAQQTSQASLTTSSAAKSTAEAASSAASTAATTASTAQSTATAAQTTANAACVSTPAVPGAEMVGGAAGTNNKQCRPKDSVQPRITRVGPFTTGTGGTVAVTWTDMGAVPALIAVPNVAAGSTQAPQCFPVAGTVTSTGGTIKCTTKVVTISVFGLSTAPIDVAASGVIGSFLAIPNS